MASVVPNLTLCAMLVLQALNGFALLPPSLLPTSSRIIDAQRRPAAFKLFQPKMVKDDSIDDNELDGFSSKTTLDVDIVLEDSGVVALVDKGGEERELLSSMNATTSATAVSPIPAPGSNDEFVRWDLWTKRLMTSEDAFSIHKLSAIVYTITSFTMMGTGVTRWIAGRQELFATLPDFIEPCMYLFCISNLIMCIASIRMAWIHRRNDLASRNAFVGTAGSSIFSGYFLLWASPFPPEYFTATIASAIGFGTLTLWNMVFVTDTVIRANEIIQGRREKTNKSSDNNENASYTLEYLRYVASGAWGLPVVVLTAYISAVAHDHDWLMQVFQHQLDIYGHGIQASVFYNNVLASMAAAYGSLCVTLRDKKLISKRAEYVGILAFSIPALIWTIDVTARIVPYYTSGMDSFVVS